MFTFQAALRPDRLRLCDSRVAPLQTINVRHVSLNSAIRQGRENAPDRRKRDENNANAKRDRPPNEDQERPPNLNSALATAVNSLQKGFERSSKKFDHPPKVSKFFKKKSAAKKGDHIGATNNGMVLNKISRVAPYSIPYRTPTSEFVYGTSAVQSAVRCGRRKLHLLYIYDAGVGKSMEDTRWGSSLGRTLAKFMIHSGGRVKHVGSGWLRLLDKMSDGRPHNGFVLDASPLPKLPAESYRRVESPASTEFHVNMASQPKEEAEINGADGCIRLAPYRAGAVDDGSTEPQRYPFTLLLDGVLDTGNLGGIIRSAHYLGVDAVAFSARNSAPLSPVTIKASAGAAESIPLISINDTSSFINKSRNNGWRFFAAMAPTSAGSDNEEVDATHGTLTPSELSSQLRESPCILMLGGEGAGLSKKLSNAADEFVAVPGVYTSKKEEDQAGVDSLNVSVATALLSEAFLREYSDTQARKARLEAETKATQEQNQDEEDRMF